jgi:hypothetical protein
MNGLDAGATGCLGRYAQLMAHRRRFAMKNYRTILISALISAYLLAISALLTLAIDQAVSLTRLYGVSASPGPVTDFSNLRRLSFSNELLILVILAVISFVLVFRHPRRLLPLSITAVLLFVALNLCSGRHLLLQILIWPTPGSLVEQYTWALAADDLEAALRLTDGSEACEAIIEQVFQEHRAKLRQRIGDDQPETGIKNISLKRITTFYEKPVPQRFLMMQPVPSQRVSTLTEMENGKNIWLSLKMRYTPFFGTRYICGQDIG